MNYYIVSEKNGDRSLVCAKDEADLLRIISEQDDDFEYESHLHLAPDTFNSPGFVMYEPK